MCKIRVQTTHEDTDQRQIYWRVRLYMLHPIAGRYPIAVTLPIVARPEEILNYDFYNKSGIFWERNSSEIDWWYFFYSGTSLKWVTTVQSFEISNFFPPNFHRNGIHRMAQSIDRWSPGFALATHLRRTLGMGSMAAAHESFFLSFFLFFGFRLSVQVQVKGNASFEGLPRLCGRPRDCRHAGSIGRRLVRSIPGCKNSSLHGGQLTPITVFQLQVCTSNLKFC